MKKIVALLVLVFAFAILTFAVSADTFNGTMVRSSNADPNLFFHDGYYYLTQTGTSRIAVFKSSTLSGLDSLAINSNISYTAYLNGTVYDPTVEELFGEGASINGTWSPEIHYFSEEQFPGNSGWYMFLGLRKNTGDSSMVRMVVLKSTTDSPKGPYGHPTEGTANHSQPLLDKNGDIWDEWGCGQTILTIPEGEYKGTYAMWVSEEGRGYSGSSGRFYQKIIIAKLTSPWQLSSDPGVVTTPTQEWEYAGASSTHPRVVEGATPVYGKNGEIFLTYSGSGYWSDYGLGQLTWNGGDPLETSSWVKLPVANGNPIFTATTAENLRGAGHASFLTDTDGNGFFCYHAYAYNSSTDTKASSRDAYIEPYSIDYTKWNGVSYGVISLGLNGTGVAADTSSIFTFATDGEYLTAPSITAEGGKTITLTLSESGAAGYLIYRSADGKVFDYLTTVNATSYTDSDVTVGNTYYYRAYAYREEEISDVSETVNAKAEFELLSPSLTTEFLSNTVVFSILANSDYDSVRIYYSTDDVSYQVYMNIQSSVASGEEIMRLGSDLENGTYYFYAVGIKYGYESSPSGIEEVEVFIVPMPEIAELSATCSSVTLQIDEKGNTYDGFRIFRSLDGKNIDFTDTTTSTVYVDTDVVLGNKYYYMVTGIIGDFESSGASLESITVAHVELIEEAQAATCTEDGHSEYTYCDSCGEILTEKEVIQAKGHSYELTEEEVPATITSVGKTAVYTCSACGDSYGGEEIPMLEDTDTFTMAGDANGDGEVTLVDVLRVLKAVVGDTVEINNANADMDGDSEITISDVLAVLKASLDA